MTKAFTAIATYLMLLVCLLAVIFYAPEKQVRETYTCDTFCESIPEEPHGVLIKLDDEQNTYTDSRGASYTVRNGDIYDSQGRYVGKLNSDGE